MYYKITEEEFSSAYYYHQEWLAGSLEGKRMEFENRDFSDLKLNGLNLSFSSLKHNFFRDVSAQKTNFRGADLSQSQFIGTDLREADFSYADFSNCRLKGCVITAAIFDNTTAAGTNFFDGVFKNCLIKNSQLFRKTQSYPISCPEKGSFIGFKKAENCVVELLIPEDAKRSSAFGRKCRCDKAKVLSISNLDGTPAGKLFVKSDYDPNFIYLIGETVEVTNFDEDRWNECSNGIHFYITFEEASQV